MNFFTADLCDKYKHNVQVCEPVFKSYGGLNKFYGQIATCKLKDNNAELIKLLKSDGNGRVCIVDVDAKYLAVVGDKLTGFAYENGWSGIIVNGYIRDIETTKKFDVGLLALGTCPKKAYHDNDGKLGIDLEFAGVLFKEGDYVYVDSDGVIVSKQSLLD
jgi:regulator of ribonuclease activity A